MSPSDWDLPCEPPSKPIVERLDEPIDAAGECCLEGGRPCILFSGWDYAEDWSGTFVRVVPHASLAHARALDRKEFWARVREVHGLPHGGS